MEIIGHRGAAGLALENTIESIKAAVDIGVDAVEFDIRLTKDNKLVLNHDRHLGRVSHKSLKINQQSLAKLKQIRLHNGEEIVTIGEAIAAAKDTSLVIEAKENDWAQPLASFLKSVKDVPKFCVASLNHRELYTFHMLLPNVPVYAVERTKPFNVIQTAKILGFDGIDINFWLLNPFSYLLARHHKLNIFVYTVDKPWMARYLRILYPKISITTNVPNKLQFLRKKRRSVLTNSSKQ